MPPGQGTQVPCGQRAGEVMAAMTATPERVRVGFRTSILSRSRSSGVALLSISALLGRDERASRDEASFLCDSRSACVLISPASMASTMRLSSTCQGLAIPACRKRLFHSETDAKVPSITTTIRLDFSFCLRLLILLLNLLGKVAAQQARDEHACHQDLLFGHIF